MSFESAFRRARGALVGAVVGGTAPHGMGVGGEILLTAVIFAVTTAIWVAARAFGILGSASLYFPALLIVTLFAGWGPGLVTLVASASVIWIVARAHYPAVSLAIFLLAGALLLAIAGVLRELLREAWASERTLRTLARQREREADRREMALGEARHRLKNLFAIIEALAKFSGPRPGTDPAADTFMRAFTGRLRALGTASDLVLKQGLGVLEARAMIGAVLEPFETPERLRFDGPEIVLEEHFGGSLALAVHELATNALKYGALTVPQGSVLFQWSVTPAVGGDRIVFEWRETGGPPPSPAARDGFGHRMIRSVTQREAEGEVSIDYRPEGLLCRISYLRKPAPGDRKESGARSDST